MKVTVAPRASGRTTAVIRRSAETGATIVCFSTMEATNVMTQAQSMGLEIPYPITFYQFLKQSGLRGHAYIIDNLDLILESLTPGNKVIEVTFEGE